VNGKVREFDYLIGSDGYNSVVRKGLGIRDRSTYSAYTLA
jgi:2-polyprenyl-6-methoxyphenol hydroxylase-like FAD-dependent oxidoreductase